MNWTILLTILSDIAKVIAAIEAVFGPSSGSGPTPLANAIVAAAVAKHAPSFATPLTPTQQATLAASIGNYLATTANAYPSPKPTP